MSRICTTYYNYTYRSDGVKMHRYYVRDYLGSVRAVFDLYGNLEQTNDYNVTGIPSSRHLGNADVHKHTGKEFQGFNGLAWYDNNARYYDPILARFTTHDPLAEKYPWLSPYNHCANNPMRFVDKDGMRITYTENDIEYTYTNIGDEYGFYDANGNLYSGNTKFVNELTSALSEIQSVPEGQSVVSELMSSQHTFEIREGIENGFIAKKPYYSQIKRINPNATKFGSGGYIIWNPSNTIGGPDEIYNHKRDAYIGLAHEFGHGSSANKGTYNLEPYQPNNPDQELRKVTKDEYNAIKFENKIRKSKGLRLRKAHTIDSNGSLFMPIIY